MAAGDSQWRACSGGRGQRGSGKGVVQTLVALSRGHGELALERALSAWSHCQVGAVRARAWGPDWHGGSLRDPTRRGTSAGPLRARLQRAPSQWRPAGPGGHPQSNKVRSFQKGRHGSVTLVTVLGRET